MASKYKRKSIEFVNRIYEKNNPLVAVVDDPNLLKEHIDAINNAQYIKIKHSEFKTFALFKKNYPAIHKWWKRLINSCYKPEYKMYKFIGARGIKLSDEFKDSKQFCIWCLKNKLIYDNDTYIAYLQRKDKTKDYSVENCFVVREKDIHEGKSLKILLDNVYFTKRYVEHHDDSVTYMCAYTRYYVWDLDIETSCTYEYNATTYCTTMYQLGFLQKVFYLSVATEDDVPWPVFESRAHYARLCGKFYMRPYDALRPEYSVSEEARNQGKPSYVAQYWKTYERPELRGKNKKQNKQLDENPFSKFYDPK